MNLDTKYSYCHPTEIPLSNEILEPYLNHSNPYIMMLIASVISDNKTFFELYSKNDPYINWGLHNNPYLKSAIHSPYSSYFNFEKIILSEAISIPYDLIIDLSKNPSFHIILANNPLIEPQHLELLCNYKNSEVFTELAKNTKITPKIIQFLLENSSEKTLYTLASNKKISVENMVTLYSLRSEIIESGLALNPKIPFQIKEKLITNPFSVVRKYLVYNNSLTDDDMLRLSHDKSPEVRKHVAWVTENQEILMNYANEIDYEIKEIIARKIKCINTLHTLSLTTNQKILFSLVLNKNTSSETLTKMIHKPLDFKVLENLVLHPNASEDVHSYLCILEKKELSDLLARVSPYSTIIESIYNKEFKNKSVRSIIAMNKSTPDHILEHIYEFNDESSKYLSTNPNLPDLLLNKILENPVFSIDAWVNLARYCTNENILWTLFSKNKERIYESLALNPNSSPVLLSRIPDTYLKQKMENSSWKPNIDIAINTLDG